MEQDETGTGPLDFAAMPDAQVGMVLQLVLLNQWNDLSDKSRAVITEAMRRLLSDAHVARPRPRDSSAGYQGFQQQSPQGILGPYVIGRCNLKGYDPPTGPKNDEAPPG